MIFLVPEIEKPADNIYILWGFNIGAPIIISCCAYMLPGCNWCVNLASCGVFITGIIYACVGLDVIYGSDDWADNIKGVY